MNSSMKTSFTRQLLEIGLAFIKGVLVKIIEVSYHGSNQLRDVSSREFREEPPKGH